ncbi:MAG TPA: septum formation initiator family protein [Nocardioides sp.]|nr:septum formation initiator family protein [Nocardioides sp.]
MPDQRRTPRGSRPGGRAGPGRAQRTGRPAAATPAAAREPQSAGRRLRPRLTGRAAILVLVLAVLAVSYASSLRAYLEQRSHIVELKATIAERRASIDELELEKQRWEDPAYVSAQARERFGYVKPGATPFVVLGEDGEPLQSESELTDPDTIAPEEKRAWYDDAWDSVKLAGHPPTKAPPIPLRKIDGSDKQQPE